MLVGEAEVCELYRDGCRYCEETDGSVLGMDGTHCYLLERLLPGVCADVVVEGGGSGEGSAAVAALEGPVAGVRDHVIAQLGRL